MHLCHGHVKSQCRWQKPHLSAQIIAHKHQNVNQVTQMCIQDFFNQRDRSLLTSAQSHLYLRFILVHHLDTRIFYVRKQKCEPPSRQTVTTTNEPE